MIQCISKPIITIFILVAILISGCGEIEISENAPGNAPNDSIVALPPPPPDYSEKQSSACCGYTNGDGSNGNTSMPLFDWPPPAASATYVLRGFQEAQSYNMYSLGDFDNVLAYALDNTGYVERSYFSVPDGYALVTRLERILDDGTIVANNRWSIDDSALEEFSFAKYIQRLLFAEPGLFRVVVFVVTPHPFNQTEDVVTQDETLDWLRTGYNVLPRSIAEMRFTNEYNITALIYQFEKRDNEDPIIVANSSLTGQRHLEAAGILDFIY